MKSARLLFWAALAAGVGLWPGAGAARAEGMFYLAPKVMIGEQKASFKAASTEIRHHPAYPGNYPMQDHFAGKYPGQDFKAADSTAFGVLAFGLDFHDRFEVPLRLEVEISTKSDSKTVSRERYSVLAPGESINPNTPGIYPGVSYRMALLSYTTHTAFVNLYADWRNQTRFTPYAGGGLGAAFIEARAEVYAEAQVKRNPNGANAGINMIEDFGRVKKTNLAWHLDAGTAFQLTEHMSLDLGYRYLNIGDVPLSGEPIIGDADVFEMVLTGPDKIKFEPSHQMVLGLRYTF